MAGLYRSCCLHWLVTLVGGLAAIVDEVGNRNQLMKKRKSWLRGIFSPRRVTSLVV